MRRLRVFGYSILYSPPLLRLFDRQSPSGNLGALGERLAERNLKQNGYVILAKNHRTRFGELDLIAVDERTVVFVEVKTRSTLDAGLPTDAVDQEKQEHISQAAMEYVRRHHLRPVRCRFDVFAIDFADDPHKPNIVHYKNAFEFAFDSE
jgi:putative endonuclease